MAAAHHVANEVLDEPMPCDGCQHAEFCNATGFACRAFVVYVQGGKAWARQPRQPTLAIGKRLGLVGK